MGSFNFTGIPNSIHSFVDKFWPELLKRVFKLKITSHKFSININKLSENI